MASFSVNSVVLAMRHNSRWWLTRVIGTGRGQNSVRLFEEDFEANIELVQIVILSDETLMLLTEENSDEKLLLAALDAALEWLSKYELRSQRTEVLTTAFSSTLGDVRLHLAAKIPLNSVATENRSLVNEKESLNVRRG